MNIIYSKATIKQRRK